MNEAMALMTEKETAICLGLKLSRIRYETFLKQVPYIKIGRGVHYSKHVFQNQITVERVVDSATKTGLDLLYV